MYRIAIASKKCERAFSSAKQTPGILYMFNIVRDSLRNTHKTLTIRVCVAADRINNIQIHARTRTYINTKYLRTVMSCKLNRC